MQPKKFLRPKQRQVLPPKSWQDSTRKPLSLQKRAQREATGERATPFVARKQVFCRAIRTATPPGLNLGANQQIDLEKNN